MWVSAIANDNRKPRFEQALRGRPNASHAAVEFAAGPKVWHQGPKVMACGPESLASISFAVPLTERLTNSYDYGP